MVQNGIGPWSPKQLLLDNLQRQLELAARSPLRFINVTEGLAFYGKQVGGVLAPLTREKFVQMSLELFRLRGLHCPPEEACICYDVFDAIDLYQNASLSLGEMAGGLSSFFCGSVEQRTQAVFDLLAQGHANQVPKSALREFLQPYVWAMVPSNATVLRPILLPHVTDDLFADITLGQSKHIEISQLVRWMSRGNQIAVSATKSPTPVFASTVVDRVAQVIDMAVQVAWREHQTRTELRAYGQESWAQQHGGQRQLLGDVGAYRYVSDSIATSQPSDVWSSIVHHSSQAYQSTADTSAQLYQTSRDLWESRNRVDSDGSSSVTSARPRLSTDFGAMAIQPAALAH